jgi:ABC-type transporter Mla subunit MlaD
VAVVFGVVLVVVLLTIVIGGGSPTTHPLHVRVAQATNVLKGQWIREGGVKVGQVTGVKPIDRGRAVRIDLSIDDDAWPIPQATTMEVRYGGTITYANRYIRLVRGPRTGPMMRDGFDLPAARFKRPLEVDTLLKTFDPALRTDLKGFFDRVGPAMQLSRTPLRASLQQRRAPSMLREGSAVFEDFNAAQGALKALIVSGDRVVDSVQRANPDVGSLVQGAAGTYDAIAAEARGVQQTLDQAPATLVTTRATLRQAQSTLASARALTDKLAPGVTELRRVASPLAHALTTVADVGPDAHSTLRTLRTAAPDIGGLVANVTDTMPSLKKVGSGGAEAMHCIRPYSPEVAGFFSNWAGFTIANDGRNKYVRLALQASPYPSATPLTAEQFQKLFPNLKYAFPRPPGYNGGQPWFLDECQAGKDALDPTKNPLDDYRPGREVVGQNDPAKVSK